jgi:DNA-binding NtrC family response regulator
VEICLPPLRDRGKDIELLADAILQRLCHRLGRIGLTLSREAMDCLCAYRWIGNIRELENILEMAAIVCDTGVIDLGHLSPRVRQAHRDIHVETVDAPASELTAAAMLAGDNGKRVVAPIKDVEADVIRNALQEYNCNIAQVSRLLGISRSTIYRKMREIGLSRQVHVEAE